MKRLHRRARLAIHDFSVAFVDCPPGKWMLLTTPATAWIGFNLIDYPFAGILGVVGFLTLVACCLTLYPAKDWGRMNTKR